MTSWKELKTERKSILSIVEISIVLMGLTLLSVIFLGYRALDTSKLIYQAGSGLRQAGDQLEEYHLGSSLNAEANFNMLNFVSLSPLPAGSSWESTRKAMKEAQANMSGLVQSNKNFMDLQAKSKNAFIALETNAKSMIEKNKGAATAQDVLLSAHAINDWIAQAPVPEMHQIESAYMSEKIKAADAALIAKGNEPEVATLKQGYDTWMTALSEQLLEEKAFVDQKKIAKNQIAGISINIEQHANAWIRKTKIFTQGFAVLFGLLIALGFFNLQSLKRNPHLNAMFANKSTDALQAELEAVTQQVDQILANVDKAWLDSRAELKVVHHAIQDSEVLESQVQQLKTDLSSVISSISKTLQELEHHLRKSNAADADKVATILGETQSSSSRIQQSLDVLAESGYSIHDELQQVRKNIKKLMSETLSLKKEGESLEESTEAINSV